MVSQPACIVPSLLASSMLVKMEPGKPSCRANLRGMVPVKRSVLLWVFQPLGNSPLQRWHLGRDRPQRILWCFERVCCGEGETWIFLATAWPWVDHEIINWSAVHPWCVGSPGIWAIKVQVPPSHHRSSAKVAPIKEQDLAKCWPLN